MVKNAVVQCSATGTVIVYRPPAVIKNQTILLAANLDALSDSEAGGRIPMILLNRENESWRERESEKKGEGDKMMDGDRDRGQEREKQRGSEGYKNEKRVRQ